MNIIYDTQKQLELFQDNVIGFFKPHASKQLELVVSKEQSFVKSVYIGSLGGLTTTHYDESNGKLVLFTDGQSLSDLKRNPFLLQEITDSFK